MRFALVLLLAALPAHAQMYKCVDERGVTHYSDKPRPGCKGGEVNIQAIPPVGGEVRPPASRTEEGERDFQRRRIAREQAEEKERRAAAERCRKARSELAFLQNARRVATLNDKGERVFLEDSARERRIAQLQGETRGCP